MCTKVISLEECSEAQVGQLERVKFFPRMLLAVDDMVTESEYHREKLKRHNRYLHGTGIVCGLEVTPAPTAALPLQVKIGTGYALGPCGDEIFVGESILLDLSKCGPDATTDPCEPSIVRGVSGVRGTVFIVIKYSECFARPVRAMPAGCACEDEDCEYSRVRDSFQISCLDRPPAGPPLPPSFCDVIHDDAPLTCPPAPVDPWVLLARVTVPSVGQPVNTNNIDNTVRRYIFSSAVMQAQMIICCCGEDHPKPQAEPNPLLKVANIRFLRGVEPANPTSGNSILDMVGLSLNPSQPLKNGLLVDANAVEVVFTGPTVDLTTIDSSRVKVEDQSGVIPGKIVKGASLPENTIRWVFDYVPVVSTVALPPRFLRKKTPYTLTLAGTGPIAIKSSLGDALDGEHKQFPSGDDKKGGDFVLNFRAS